MSTRNDPAPSHRERKKNATRERLGEAALRLAVEHGLEHVRVEQIAAAAEVSPRTFNNYFSSKEQAIVSLLAGRARRFAAAVAAADGTAPLWEAIAEAAAALAPADDEAERWRPQVRLILDTPALEAEYFRVTAAVERELAQEITDRTGETGLYPRLAACAAVGAIRAALLHWIDEPDSPPYTALLRQAITRVGAGLPAPTE
ncbi:TetR/AcrR family transcriptional regulator [Glycomyces tenuis]|uniref:TetR/AcrR family transcriptional regulator n=1 Tax=Glycomyces tenuis TaxID=58116 RepID=UPI0004143504|nr:TetR family transcriptional regulator [Glycomyces tenuis]